MLKKPGNRLLTRAARQCASSVLLLHTCLWTANLVDGQVLAPLPFQIQSSRTFIGVHLADLTADRAKELKIPEWTGAEISFVVEGTPAYQAGLRSGDVIVTYNGEKVLGREQLSRLVAETPPGRRVPLVCWRGGEKRQVSVTTGLLHASGADDVPVVTTLRLMDVPSTLMLWRDLVLGIESEALNEQLVQAWGVKQGILIWTVAAGSPAQHAGLRAGDVLTDFCGRAIHSPREVGAALQQLQTSEKAISANVIRDHKAISLSISFEGNER